MITILILVGTLALISASTIKGRICDWTYTLMGEGRRRNHLVHQLQADILFNSMKNYAYVAH